MFTRLAELFDTTQRFGRIIARWVPGVCLVPCPATGALVAQRSPTGSGLRGSIRSPWFAGVGLAVPATNHGLS